MAYIRRRLALQAHRYGQNALGYLVVGMLKSLRIADPDMSADFNAWLMRHVGPFLRENRIARDNIRAAFPEKSSDEIEKILTGSWDNLGRISAEFAQLDRLRRDHPGRLEYTPATEAAFMKMYGDGKPALVFAAHLANWEMPAVSSVVYGLPSTVLFRAPNLKPVADAIRAMREKCMGTMVATGLDAPLKLARALERGDHVGMLVDQYFSKGVEVTFFGRKCKANPLLALLARQVDCPIHGTRAIRRKDRSFLVEITDEIKPVRDVAGKIDIQGTTQVITNVIEGWIREYPEQWLWMHRRWR